MSKRLTVLLTIIATVAAGAAIAYFGSSTIYPADMSTPEGVVMTVVVFIALVLWVAVAMLAIMLFG